MLSIGDVYQAFRSRLSFEIQHFSIAYVYVYVFCSTLALTGNLNLIPFGVVDGTGMPGGDAAATAAAASAVASTAAAAASAAAAAAAAVPLPPTVEVGARGPRR